MPARLTVASPSNAATRKFRFDLPNCVCAAGQEHTPLKLVVVACRMPSRVGNNINTELFLDGGPASWSPIKLYLLGGDQSRGTEHFDCDPLCIPERYHAASEISERGDLGARTQQSFYCLLAVVGTFQVGSGGGTFVGRNISCLISGRRMKNSRNSARTKSIAIAPTTPPRKPTINVNNVPNGGPTPSFAVMPKKVATEHWACCKCEGWRRLN